MNVFSLAVNSGPLSPGLLIDTVLCIDGLEHRVSHDIRAALLDTLRELFGQHGDYDVTVNGEPEFGSATLTVAAQGQEIRTNPMQLVFPWVFKRIDSAMQA